MFYQIRNKLNRK